MSEIGSENHVFYNSKQGHEDVASSQVVARPESHFNWFAVVCVVRYNQHLREEGGFSSH